MHCVDLRIEDDFLKAWSPNSRLSFLVAEALSCFRLLASSSHNAILISQNLTPK
jgi:hypothetical protein